MFHFEKSLLTFTKEVPLTPPSPLGGEGKSEGKKEVRYKGKKARVSF